ncbi:MAG: SapC family protein [Methylocystis silviterrae]
MASVVAVDRERHAGKGWRPAAGYGFATTQALLPLMGVEFAQAAASMPIAFIEQAGRYRPVAVLSPVQGRNLFVGPGGQWLGTYVPALLRGYPFGLLRMEDSEKAALCIDESSGLVVDADGETQKFFEDDGSPSEAIKAILNFLQQVEQNRTVTDLAVAALAEAGLMAPWPLTVSVDNQPRTVNGFYRVEEAKLNALDDESFLKLRKSGALPLAYMQLLSMGRVTVFKQLDQLQRQLSEAAHQAKELSLDEFFAKARNETLQFS